MGKCRAYLDRTHLFKRCDNDRVEGEKYCKKHKYWLQEVDSPVLPYCIFDGCKNEIFPKNNHSFFCFVHEDEAYMEEQEIDYFEVYKGNFRPNFNKFKVYRDAFGKKSREEKNYLKLGGHEKETDIQCLPTEIFSLIIEYLMIPKNQGDLCDVSVSKAIYVSLVCSVVTGYVPIIPDCKLFLRTSIPNQISPFFNNMDDVRCRIDDIPLSFNIISKNKSFWRQIYIVIQKEDSHNGKVTKKKFVYSNTEVGDIIVQGIMDKDMKKSYLQIRNYILINYIL